MLMFMLDASRNLVLLGCALLVHQQVPYDGRAMMCMHISMALKVWCNSGITKLIGSGVSVPQGESQWNLLLLPLCLAAEEVGGRGQLILCQFVL